MPVLPSTHLTRHHTGGPSACQSLPHCGRGGPVAGFLLRLRVGVRGQPGKPPARPWARAVEEAPARTPRLALQVHGRRPRGSPSARREDLPRGQGQPLAMRASPRLSRAQRGQPFLRFPPGNQGMCTHHRAQPGPESRSQRCFRGSRSGRTRLQSDVPAAPARGQ